MIKIDKDFKNKITLKSTKKTNKIKFLNKSKDKIDFPFWIPINDKEYNLFNIINNEIIDYDNSIKVFYFYYKGSKIFASSELNEDFLINLSSSLYKATFSSVKDTMSIKSSNSSLFFNIDTLIWNYNPEEVAKTVLFKNNYEEISNCSIDKNFIKFNVNLTKEEFYFFRKIFSENSIYYKELSNLSTYLKVKDSLLAEQKNILLTMYDTINNIIISKIDMFKNISQKYQKEYNEPFVPSFFFYFKDANIKRRIEILKYFPISTMDYSIYPYFAFPAILYKDNKIVTVPIDEESYNNNKYSFSCSPLNMIIEYCGYNTDCIKEALLLIIDLIENEAKVQFDYKLIIPKKDKKPA